MGLYAFKTRDRFERFVTNVCAGDDRATFDEWTDSVTDEYTKRGEKPAPKDLFEEFRLSSLLETLQNPDYHDLKYVRIFAHYDEEQQRRFIDQQNITLMSKNRCQERQQWMLKGRPEDQWIREGGAVDKVIADIIGEPLVEKDPSAGIHIDVGQPKTQPSPTTIGGKDSLMGVVDIRSHGNDTQIVAKFRPSKIVTCVIERTNENAIIVGSPSLEDVDWIKTMHEIGEVLKTMTNGRCYYTELFGRFAVPTDLSAKLSDLLPEFEQISAKRKDFVWNYDYMQQLKMARVMAIESVYGDGNDGNDSSINLDAGAELKEAALVLDGEFQDRVSEVDRQNALANAVEQIGDCDDVAEIIAHARAYLNEIIADKLDGPDTPDNEEILEGKIDKIRVTYLPDTVQNIMKARGYNDYKVTCIQYPLITNEVILPLDDDFEIPLVVNLRLVNTISLNGKKTALYRFRRPFEPAYIVMYRPGNQTRQFEVLYCSK